LPEKSVREIAVIAYRKLPEMLEAVRGSDRKFYIKDGFHFVSFYKTAMGGILSPTHSILRS
jgi:hypothetical protein